MDRAERTAFVSVLTHGGLVAVAAALALLSGSAATLANAWLLMAGLAGSALAWAGRRMSGPGRPVVPVLLWNLFALAVGVGVLWGAVAVVRQPGRVPSLPALALAGSAALALAAYVTSRRETAVGIETDDPGLIAAGRHSGIAVAGSVLAAVGLGAEAAGLPLDRVASLAIAALVGASGVGLLACVAEALRSGTPVRSILPVTIPRGRPSRRGVRASGRLRTRLWKTSDLLFHPAHRWRTAAVAGGALLLAWALTTVSFVGAGSVGIVGGRGAERELAPGLHFKLPYPIERTVRVASSGLLRVTTGARAPAEPPASEARRLLGLVLAWVGVPVREPARSAPVPDEVFCLTGDGRLVVIEAAAHYAVESPSAVSLSVSDPGDIVAPALAAEVAHAASSMPCDSIVGTGRGAFEEAVAAGLARRLGAMGLGVTVRSVHLVRVAPPPDAARAFAASAFAPDAAERLVVDAGAAATRAGSEARLEAARAVSDARNYRVDRLSRAEADAARFLLLAPEHRRARGVTETRLYIETMEELLAGVEKTIVSSGLELADYDPAALDRALAPGATTGQ